MAPINVSRRAALRTLASGMTAGALSAVAVHAVAAEPTPQEAEERRLIELYWKLSPAKRPHLIGLLEWQTE